MIIENCTKFNNNCREYIPHSCIYIFIIPRHVSRCSSTPISSIFKCICYILVSNNGRCGWKASKKNKQLQSTWPNPRPQSRLVQLCIFFNSLDVAFKKRRKVLGDVSYDPRPAYTPLCGWIQKAFHKFPRYCCGHSRWDTNWTNGISHNYDDFAIILCLLKGYQQELQGYHNS